MLDKYTVACNLKERTATASLGALAYVLDSNRGNGGDRQLLLIRSHGGRWIKKWENANRLTNFRIKTIPPAHPFYSDAPLWHPFRITLYGSREEAERRNYLGSNKPWLFGKEKNA